MLTKGGGSIINISSGAAYRPLEGWSAYCAGKAGPAMGARSIQLEAECPWMRNLGFFSATIHHEKHDKIRPPRLKIMNPIPRANLAPSQPSALHRCCSCPRQRAS